MEALQGGTAVRSSPPAALATPTARTAETETSAALPVAATEAAESSPEPAAASSEVSVVPTAVATGVPSAEPTAAPSPPAAAPSVLPTLALPPQPVLSAEERWRSQQIDRVVFDQVRTYATTSSELWWYDPINQQHVILGSFAGSFLAQAQFTLRGQGVQALEVPYQINVSYGLTALSPALVARIQAAEAGAWIETYVFLTPNIAPR